LGYSKSAFAYIAYTWVLVYAQRRILPEDMAPFPPAGFAELHDEIMAFSQEINKGGDVTEMYVINTEDQAYWFQEPFVRKAKFARLCSA
jgi:hypothetical protein